YLCLFPLTRDPPVSSLFPYTTLFRSVEQGITTRLAVDVSIVTGMIAAAGVNSLYIAAQTGQDFIADMGAGAVAGDPGDFFALERSEEHTSELQSRENLVCRLLLEKKT